jgi:hypothetical protein
MKLTLRSNETNIGGQMKLTLKKVIVVGKVIGDEE